MRENIIQKAIINYLQLKENLGELYFFRSWAGAVRVSWNNRDRFFKTWKAWCPDITVLKNWVFYWIEVKNEKDSEILRKVFCCEEFGGSYWIRVLEENKREDI